MQEDGKTEQKFWVIHMHISNGPHDHRDLEQLF